MFIPVRPITFWSLVAGAVFLAMTALWTFGDDPTGLVQVAATVLWWGSGLALVFFGLVTILRWGRDGQSRGERRAGT